MSTPTVRLLPLPLGEPGNHLAVSHMLKHYRNPSECWEDVVRGVPPELRPAATWRLVPDYDPASRGDTPAVRAHWEHLVKATEWGYLKTVAEATRDRPAPPEGAWVPAGPGAWKAHVGDGILLVGRYYPTAGRMQMVAAYRDDCFKNLPYDHLPRSADQVRMRRSLFENKAEHLVRRARRPHRPRRS